ncbi:GNAT family N-acetyltransferase [Enterococcus sp. LJL120]
MLTFEKIVQPKQQAAALAKIKQLYQAAFPRLERMPFWFLQRKLKNPAVELLSVWQKDSWLGFLYSVVLEDKVFIFYFAIDPNQQGQRYGSKVLQELPTVYSGKKIGLTIEALDSSAKNQQQRIKRKNFYLKNGFVSQDLFLKEFGVLYEFLAYGGRFTFQEVEACRRKLLGQSLATIIPSKEVLRK